MYYKIIFSIFILESYIKEMLQNIVKNVEKILSKKCLQNEYI